LFEQESAWIRDQLRGLDLSGVKTVLDVGSSTLDFRTRARPYIDQNVFKPLRTRGMKIFHLDKKKAEGVDIEWDVNQLDSLGAQFDLVICTSLLEHVEDRAKVLTGLRAVTRQKGFLLVTVPHNYIYHEDPIDTMYRPSPDELSQLFEDWEVVKKQVIMLRGTGHDGEGAIRHRYLEIVDILLDRRFERFRDIFILLKPIMVSGVIARNNLSEERLSPYSSAIFGELCTKSLSE